MENDNSSESADNQPEVSTQSFVERCRALAEKTQNPLYVWMALSACGQAACPTWPMSHSGELTLPGWIAEYLLTISSDLQTLSAGIDKRVDPLPVRGPLPGEEISDYIRTPEVRASYAVQKIPLDKAMELVPAALGLTRKGWNAFASFAATTAKMHGAAWYETARASGIPAKQAKYAMATALGISDIRHIDKRNQEGRELLSTQDVTKPEE